MSVQAKFLFKRCCFFLFKAEGDTQRGLLLSALINTSAGTQLGRVALPVWSRAVPCRRAWPLLQVSQLFAGREGTARRGQVSAVDVLCLAMGREETAVWTALQHTAALLEQRSAGQTGLVLLPCADHSCKGSDTASAPAVLRGTAASPSPGALQLTGQLKD